MPKVEPFILSQEEGSCQVCTTNLGKGIVMYSEETTHSPGMIFVAKKFGLVKYGACLFFFFLMFFVFFLDV